MNKTGTKISLRSSWSESTSGAFSKSLLLRQCSWITAFDLYRVSSLIECASLPFACKTVLQLWSSYIKKNRNKFKSALTLAQPASSQSAVSLCNNNCYTYTCDYSLHQQTTFHPLTHPTWGSISSVVKCAPSNWKVGCSTHGH